MAWISLGEFDQTLETLSCAASWDERGAASGGEVVDAQGPPWKLLKYLQLVSKFLTKLNQFVYLVSVEGGMGWSVKIGLYVRLGPRVGL